MQTLKTFQATLSNGQTIRVMAKDSYEARKIIQQMHGLRACPTLPKMVAH